MRETHKRDSYETRDGDISSGGISIFVSRGIECRILNSLSYSNQTIEVCTVELSFADMNVILIGIYRPYSDTIENFSSHLENFLSSSQISGKFCILMGDLNICILRDEPANNNFSNLLFSLHYSPLITKATRFPIREDESPSALDHIWINKFFTHDCRIHEVDLTDHIPTFMRIN